MTKTVKYRAFSSGRGLILSAMLVLGGCTSEPDAGLPGNAQDDQPFAGIDEGETIHLTGTEPFWGGEVSGGLLSYTTALDPDGQRMAVTRFAGRGGLSFSGEEDGVRVDVAITPAPCSDGMSDRTYPFVVTLQWGEDQRSGCGWSDMQPFDDGEE